MQTTLLLVAKLGLLLLLWFFIWMTVRALRKDVRVAAQTSTSASQVSPGAASTSAAPDVGAQASISGRAPSRITVISGPLTGTYLVLQGYKEVTIGRSQHCTLVLEDDFASGSHSRLFVNGGHWYVEDLDSRNGTWIGSQRIDQPERLFAGMEIRIGQTHVRMEV